MDGGGLGPSFAPPIQQTANLSNVVGALSFDAFAFFPTNAGAPTTAPGMGTGRSTFTTAEGAATTSAVAAASAATNAARIVWCFGRGVAHIVQYLPPLLEEAHAPHSQLEAEEEEAMMGELCMLAVRVLHALIFVRLTRIGVPKNQQTTAYWGLLERSFQQTNLLHLITVNLYDLIR
jgi:hypothetical protein